MISFDTFTSIRDVLAGPIGFIFLMAGAAALVYWRTKSMHVFWSRLWVLFVSRRCRADSPVEKYHEEQMEMLKFRFCTNIPVRTPRHVAPVIEWMQAHDQDASTIVACGSFFDVSVPGLTPAAQNFKAKWAVAPLILGVGFFLASFKCLYVMTLDRALLQFKATGHWFTLDAALAKPLGDSPGFLLSRCKDAPALLAKQSGFDTQEVSILCEAASAEDVGKFVRKSVDEQRVAFGIVAAFLFVVTLMFGNLFGRIAAMLDLRKVLLQRQRGT